MRRTVPHPKTLADSLQQDSPAPSTQLFLPVGTQWPQPASHFHEACSPEKSTGHSLQITHLHLTWYHGAIDVAPNDSISKTQEQIENFVWQIIPPCVLLAPHSRWPCLTSHNQVILLNFGCHKTTWVFFFLKSSAHAAPQVLKPGSQG